jgi:hypothetical protein
MSDVLAEYCNWIGGPHPIRLLIADRVIRISHEEAIALWVSLHAALAAHDLDVFGTVEVDR